MTPPTELAVRVVEAELLEDEGLVGQVRVRTLPNPFSLECRDFTVPEGTTLEAIVDRAELAEWTGAYVLLDGDMVPRGWWKHVRPRAGHLVTVRALPAGGDNGLKGALQIVAGVILIIVGALASGFLQPYGPGLIVAGIGLILGGLVTLLTPPPQLPRVKEFAGGTMDAPVFSITGARNQANPYGPVAMILGRHLIYPAYGALPYTELVGDDQYLRLLFVIGVGKYVIEEPKIGDTLVSSFPADELEIEIRTGDPSDPPLTLFPNDAFEEQLGIVLTDGTQHIVTTPADVDEISVDFVWPRGLVSFGLNGEKLATTSTLEVLYRPTSGGAWAGVGGAFVDNRAATVRHGIRWTVATDQYDVAVRQLDGHAELNADTRAPIFNGATWTALRTFKNVEPIDPAFLALGVARVAMRIRASERLHGVIDTFNCIATSVVPDYEISTGDWIERATANPSSLYRWVLQGLGNEVPLGDARLNVNDLEAWHEDCRIAERTFNFVVEQSTTVRFLLDQIAAVGRARFSTVNGTTGVVRDIPQSVPAGMYTPRNSRNYRGMKTFRDLPHAIRVQFISPADNWQMVEQFVYYDGYNADGSGGMTPASRFETLQFLGITDPDQAHKLGRYHLAVAYLRPEVHEFEVDVEHVRNTRGDRITFSHDVPLLGASPGSGRFRSVTLNGSGQATAVVVDEPMTMAGGVDYGLKWRRADGVIASSQVVTVAGTTATLTFSAPVAAGLVPGPDDLFQFGELGNESIDGIVIRIEMLRDIGARIVMVDYAPAVYTADTGSIPPWDPHVTLPPELQSPPAPLPDGLMSEGVSAFRTVTGTIGARAILHFGLPPTSVPMIGATVQAGYRYSGAVIPWTPMPEVRADTYQMTYAPLEPGKVYDIRIRTVSATNRPSGWVLITEVEIPNPPVITYYELDPAPHGYIARIGTQVNRVGPPDITGLRLTNAVDGNDFVFAGREAKFSWNAVTNNPAGAEDDQTQDLTLRDYVIEIWTGGVKRRFGEAVVTPGFTYSYEMNVEDHRPLGPSRSIQIRVWARNHDGRVSRNAAVLNVQNAPPDMSMIAPVVTELVDAAIASWSAFSPTDHDFERYDVYVSTANPPLELYDSRSPVQKSVIIVDLTHEASYFLQVVPVDAFGPGIGSQIVPFEPKSAAEAFQFFKRDIQVEGLTFTADEATNIVSWEAGVIHDVDNAGTTRTTAIAAGSGHYTGVSLFISWLLGAGTLDAIPDSSAAIVVGRATMAVYNGGRNLVITNGKATVHGQDILAHTIGAAQLVANQVLITGSAQIAAAIIDSFHLKDGTIDNVHIKNEAVDASRIKKATITFAEIAFAAIKGFNLGEGEIDSVHIKFAAIDSAHIKNLAVKNAQIDNLSVNGFKVTPGAITSTHRQGVNIGVASVSSQNLVTFTHNLGFIPLVTWQWIHANGTFATWLYECDETKFTVALSHPSAPILAIGTLVFKYW